MSKHRWWHNLFYIQHSSRHERTTSYNGTILFHEFTYNMKCCKKCDLYSIVVNDIKDKETYALTWVKFDEIKDLVKSVKTGTVDKRKFVEKILLS